MRYKIVHFTNHQGQKLEAVLEEPVTGKPRAYAIFAHCFSCGPNEGTVTRISNKLAMSNIGVLQFNFSGLGKSEGEFSDSNLSTQIHDIKSAANFLEAHYVKPQLLIGHSLGGAAALLASRELDYLKALVTIGAPSDMSYIEKLIEENLTPPNDIHSKQIYVGGKPFLIKQQFVEDLQKHDLHDILSQSRKALLILHSPQDKVVDISSAAGLYEAAFHPKSFISLDHADHLLTNNVDAAYVGTVISSWAVRYLDLGQDARLNTDKQAVVRTGREKYYTEIRTGNHSLVADEPLDVHGKDLGPSPYDLLVSALGACTSITLRMYADHKGLDVDEIRVHVQHWKEHVSDSQEPRGGKIDKMSREIEIIGNLTDEQKERMVHIANRCPVHKTLHGKAEIETSLKKTE